MMKKYAPYPDGLAKGSLMLDLAGYEVAPDEQRLLSSPVTGGVILFTRNYESIPQLQKLVTQIRAIKPDILIAVDHEGGRVQRFREGFTRLPPMQCFGNLYLREPALACELVRETGWLMASELRAVDIDFTFAPVLDVDVGISSVIGDRAFASRADIVGVLAQSLVAGMKDAGMAATGKHFPGHGAIHADSHVSLPVDSRTLAEIEAQDIPPFIQLIESGLDSVMPAHVIYDMVDSAPAGFSTFWLQDYLRTKLRFNGVIFSDDLSMEGASVAGGVVERVQAALTAGCDMVLVCNKPEEAKKVVDWMEKHKLVASERTATMRAKQGALSLVELQASSRWQKAVEGINQLDKEFIDVVKIE